MNEKTSGAAHPAPWVFMLTGLPYGIVGGFCSNTMPYFTRDAGFSVESIGWFSTALMLPPVLQFLYAPIVDIGPRRGVWLVLVAAIGALCLGGAICTPLPSHIGLYLALAFAGQAISGLVNSCNGGVLAATLPDELRGRAAGYLNVGNLSGASLGAWLTLALAKDWHFSPLGVGVSLAALTVGPALLALGFREPPRIVRSARVVFADMLTDVTRVARSRPGWSGILFCLSPVGTAALTASIFALAADYRASNARVELLMAVSGFVSGAGALLAGFLCDRVNRRLMYLVSGGLTAVCGFAMCLFPVSGTTFTVGVTVYFFVTGLCYASFSAVVLESIGRAGAAASTQYTLFTSAANFAAMYVGWIDTRFHSTHGPRSLLVADATANLVGVVLLALFIRFVYSKLNPESPAAT